MPEISSFELERHYPVFLRQAGRDLELTTQQQAAVRQVDPAVWAYWSVSVLSGDERIAYPYLEAVEGWFPPGTQQLFASEIEIEGDPALDFHGGELSRKLDAMHQRSRNPAQQQRFERASKTLGEWAYTVGAAIGLRSETWRTFVANVPQTVVIPNEQQGAMEVRFHGHPEASFPIDGPVDTVMTLGPGLTGSDFAGNLIGRSDTLHLVSGGKSAHFVNGYTGLALKVIASGAEQARRAGTLQSQLRPGAPLDARLPEVYMHAEGIAAALGRMSTQREVADVIVMSSVHSAGPEECLAGVEGAKALLRPGGLFVVKAPDVSLGNEAGMDIVVPEAMRMFGSPATAGACGTLQQHINPSLPRDRSVSYAIFKQE